MISSNTECVFLRLLKNDKIRFITDLLCQLNKNMSGIKTYVGDDGKLHFVDSAGADSVLPFSKNWELTFNLNTRYAINISGTVYGASATGNVVVTCNNGTLSVEGGAISGYQAGTHSNSVSANVTDFVLTEN